MVVYLFNPPHAENVFLFVIQEGFFSKANLANISLCSKVSRDVADRARRWEIVLARMFARGHLGPVGGCDRHVIGRHPTTLTKEAIFSAQTGWYAVM